MEFGERVRALRMEKKISIVQLAAVMTKTEAAIRAWEIGRTKPDLETLARLAGYFGCSADYLLGLTDLTDPPKIAAERQLDEELETLFQKIQQLPALRRAFILDIAVQTLACLENFEDEEQEAFVLWFHRLFSGIAMGRSLSGAETKPLLAEIRRVSDMDYQQVWEAISHKISSL
ncbi:MAG: helix-turn-helix domain-containing protein [Clostridiales bacterium]|nr:helix-turn-helix domain-containing protein [Clostridiales bacterium]